ncbi:MAG: hypothetical protein GF372_01140 [Candidatus Marinimicrobia bacterium]|nr:hypothetical protein [Candidatus Neomarinimicrobiota bacterium]
MDNNACIYRIDESDTIVWVNDEYDRFSAENGAEEVNAESTVGRKLWEFITDNETLHLYKIMVKKVRDIQQDISFSLRCDGPRCKRELLMHIRPVRGKQIEFYSELKNQEERDPQNLLSIDAQRSDDILVLCGWCNKVKLPDEEWVEVEEAAEELHLFNESKLPRLSHGMCDSCRDAYFGTIDEFVQKQSA